MAIIIPYPIRAASPINHGVSDPKIYANKEVPKNKHVLIMTILKKDIKLELILGNKRLRTVEDKLDNISETTFFFFLEKKIDDQT